jgi:hypothetical protein
MRIKIGERARLAAAIAARRTPSSALPEHVRREAIAYARRRVAQGASQAAVAHELAVTTMTVSRWVSMARSQAPKPQPKAAPKLRRVRVVDAAKPSRSAIVVTTAYGLRIEGLAAEDVIALLRALG